MVEASDAAMRAVTSQRWEAQRSAKGMAEASDAAMRAVTSRQREAQRSA